MDTHFTINNSKDLITLSFLPSIISFINPDGTKIELGLNDSKIIKVTTIEGKITFELIQETK